MVGFLAVLAFAAFEGTFALFLLRRMHWDARAAAFAFAAIGLLTALVQGGLIRRLVPRFGEAKLIVTGLLLAASGFAAMALAENMLVLGGAMMLLGVGQGLLSPSITGLLSRITPTDRQGTIFGTLTSAQTLARMLSYSISNVLLGRYATGAPYWGASGIDVAAVAVAGGVVTRHAARKRPTVEAADVRSAEKV